MSSELVPVQVECPCPGKPHDADTVFLRPTLGLQAGVAVQSLLINAHNAEDRLTEAELTGVLAEGYLLHGVASWTFVDDKGHTIPVTRDTIRTQLLDRFDLGEPVANKADDLYAQALFLPLVKRASASSPVSPTAKSTSARNGSTRKHQKRSKRSSTSTSTTAATAEISVSPDGGSNS